METNELYKKVLGLMEPWKVTEVNIDDNNKEIHVHMKYPADRGIMCPQCGKEALKYDEREERVWRHLDTCDYKTLIHCRIPRIKYGEHGIKTVEKPWAESLNRFTKLFERNAIFLLQITKNISLTAKFLRLSWDELSGIMKRGVERGLARREETEIEYLGVDEKNFHSGQSYVQILTDTSGKRVLDVVEHRDDKAAKEVYSCLSESQKAGIKAISMDFWQPYIKAAQENIAQADIVHDKFHIMKYMNEAVDKVRRRENKELVKRGDTTLVGTKYIFLKNPENLTEKQKTTFEELTKKQLDVNRAYQRCEMLKKLWTCDDEESAKAYFKSWYFSATHSQLEPVIKVAKMLKRHIEQIITYWEHSITNAFAEGINSVIQLIKANARGFRSFGNYRNAILFYCGKLDMAP